MEGQLARSLTDHGVGLAVFRRDLGPRMRDVLVSFAVPFRIYIPLLDVGVIL